MVVALSTLGAACVAFGVAGEWVVNHVAAPAAASVLHGGLYARSVLTGGGHLASIKVPFDYFKPSELAAVAATVVLGGLLARTYMRIREPRAVGMLRAIHNGSVNDYAAYAVFGVITAVIVLAS
jgi:multicomponent Na+:H+ antiporter subunit D